MSIAGRQAILPVVVGVGDLNGPRNLAVGPDDSIYVADTANSRIVRFDWAGKVQATWGSRTPEGQIPPAPGTFVEPWGVAIDGQGNLFVADTWNRRVAVFSAEGQFLHSWPVQAWASASLDNKPYLAVDEQGQVYVTDPEGYRVLVFSPAGEPLAALGQFGSEQNAFGLPAGIAPGPDGSVWVADARNNRIARLATLQP